MNTEHVVGVFEVAATLPQVETSHSHDFPLTLRTLEIVFEPANC